MGARNEVVTVVRLSGSLVGLPANVCVEVLPLAEPTPVPDWPPNALGVLDVRGEMVPCLDASAAVRKTPSPLTLHHCLVVVTAKNLPWALVVDEVLSVGDALVVPLSASAPEVLHPSLIVQGVIDDERGVIPVLDVERLISWLPTFEHPKDARPQDAHASSSSTEKISSPQSNGSSSEGSA